MLRVLIGRQETTEEKYQQRQIRLATSTGKKPAFAKYPA
jgi:hypothetical protein